MESKKHAMVMAVKERPWLGFLSPIKKLCKLQFPFHFHKEHTGNIYSAKDMKLKQRNKNILKGGKKALFPAYALIKTSQRKGLQRREEASGKHGCNCF